MSARTRITEPDEKRGKRAGAPSSPARFVGKVSGRATASFPLFPPTDLETSRDGWFMYKARGGGDTFCQDRGKKLNDGGLSRRGREPRHS